MTQLVSHSTITQTEMIEKAWNSESFKQELLTSPKAMVGREMGEPMPDFIDFKVLEETADRLWLIIPPRPSTLPEPEPDHENIGPLKPNELKSKPERVAALQAAIQAGELDLAQLLRAAVQQHLTLRAWEKDGFMQELLVDARAMFEQAITDLGLPVGPLPASLEIRALEETATRRYMLIPANPAEENLTSLEQAVAAGQPSRKFTRGTGRKWRVASVNAWGYSLALHGITLPYCGAFVEIPDLIASIIQ
jgi:hypothetical protein